MNRKPQRSLPPTGGQAGARRLLTVADVADRVQVSERTVRRWIAGDQLRVRRLGRSVRILPDDLDAMIQRAGERE